MDEGLELGEGVMDEGLELGEPGEWEEGDVGEGEEGGANGEGVEGWTPMLDGGCCAREGWWRGWGE